MGQHALAPRKGFDNHVGAVSIPHGVVECLHEEGEERGVPKEHEGMKLMEFQTSNHDPNSANSANSTPYYGQKFSPIRLAATNGANSANRINSYVILLHLAPGRRRWSPALHHILSPRRQTHGKALLL